MPSSREMQLNNYVAICIDCERESTLHDDAKRQATIAAAREHAGKIGFAPQEIAAAVDNAIKHAESAAS